MSIPKDIANGDWEEAFSYAPFNREEVETVLHSVEGCRDEDSWVGVFLLKDGRFGYLTAWCDYTGWDCKAGGHGDTRETIEAVIRELCSDDDRKRLGLKLPEDA